MLAYGYHFTDLKLIKSPSRLMKMKQKKQDELRHYKLDAKTKKESNIYSLLAMLYELYNGALP